MIINIDTPIMTHQKDADGNVVLDKNGKPVEVVAVPTVTKRESRNYYDADVKEYFSKTLDSLISDNGNMFFLSYFDSLDSAEGGKFRDRQYQFAGLILTFIFAHSLYAFLKELPKIPNRLFYKTPYKFGGLVSVLIFPNTVEEIGEQAFSNCIVLTSVKLPKVKKVNKMAFAEDKSLRDATFSDEINFIGEKAFYDNPQLTGNLKFSDSLTRLSADAFNKTKIQTIEVSNACDVFSSQGSADAESDENNAESEADKNVPGIVKRDPVSETSSDASVTQKRKTVNPDIVLKNLNKCVSQGDVVLQHRSSGNKIVVQSFRPIGSTVLPPNTPMNTFCDKTLIVATDETGNSHTYMLSALLSKNPLWNVVESNPNFDKVLNALLSNL